MLKIFSVSCPSLIFCYRQNICSSTAPNLAAGVSNAAFLGQFLQSGRFRAELRSLRTLTALQTGYWLLAAAVIFHIFCSCVSFSYLYGYSRHYPKKALDARWMKARKTSFVQTLHKSVATQLVYFVLLASDYCLCLSGMISFNPRHFLNQFPERNFLNCISCCVKCVNHL